MQPAGSKNNWWRHLEWGQICIGQNGLACFAVIPILLCTSIFILCIFKLALPQAAQLGIHFLSENSNAGPPRGNCMRTHYWEEEKSPAPGGNGTHGLYVARHVLYRCATSAAQVIPILMTLISLILLFLPHFSELSVASLCSVFPGYVWWETIASSLMPLNC